MGVDSRAAAACHGSRALRETLAKLLVRPGQRPEATKERIMGETRHRRRSGLSLSTGIFIPTGFTCNPNFHHDFHTLSTSHVLTYRTLMIHIWLCHQLFAPQQPSTFSRTSGSLRTHGIVALCRPSWNSGWQTPTGIRFGHAACGPTHRVR